MRLLIQIVLAALITISIGAGLLFYRAHRAMVAARQYVSDASGLQIGVSGTPEFLRIREKYSHYAEIDPNCNPAECVAKFKFDNGWPRNIYAVHSAVLYSELILSHGSITSSVIGSTCWGGDGREYGASLLELQRNPSSFFGPFREHHSLSSDKIAHLSFELTPAASPEQRARAYAFNASFLGRLSACNAATDMH
jgi:hypothetical protein